MFDWLDQEIVELTGKLAASVDSSEILELSGKRSVLLDVFKNKYGARAELVLLRNVLPVTISNLAHETKKIVLLAYDIIGPENFRHIWCSPSYAVYKHGVTYRCTLTNGKCSMIVCMVGEDCVYLETESGEEKLTVVEAKARVNQFLQTRT